MNESYEIHGCNFHLFTTDCTDEQTESAAVANMAAALEAMSTDKVAALHAALSRAYSETDDALPGDGIWTDLQMQIEDDAMLKAEDEYGKQPDDCLCRLHPA